MLVRQDYLAMVDYAQSSIFPIKEGSVMLAKELGIVTIEHHEFGNADRRMVTCWRARMTSPTLTISSRTA